MVSGPCVHFSSMYQAKPPALGNGVPFVGFPASRPEGLYGPSAASGGRGKPRALPAQRAASNSGLQARRRLPGDGYDEGRVSAALALDSRLKGVIRGLRPHPQLAVRFRRARVLR